MSSFLLKFYLFTCLFIFNFSYAASYGYSSRYSMTYGNWDEGIHSYYTYSESLGRGIDCGYYTCYDNFTAGDNVYIEETVISSGQYRGHTQINVYRSRRYDRGTLYVSYYTYENVIVRRYYSRRHPKFSSRYYYHPGYPHYGAGYYRELDEFSVSIIVGTYFAQAGIFLLSECDGEPSCILLALSSSASASLVWSFASRRERERQTALQMYFDNMSEKGEEKDISNVVEF